MGYARLLRQRHIFLLWIAQTLSVLGDRMYALAVMWLVWEESRSAALMGLVAVVESVPYVVMGTVGRSLLTRFSSLGRLAWVDVARAAVVIALPVIWAVDGANVPALLVVAALLGVLGALFDPNLGALVPDLVKPDQVQQVTGLLDLTGRIARVAGPGSAGLLLVILPETHLYSIDAATFAVSACALCWLARHHPLDAPVGGHSEPKQATGSAATTRLRTLVREHPAVGCAIAVHGAGILLSAVTIAMPVLLSEHLNAGAGTYALVATCIGLGALGGNLLAGHLRAVGYFPASYCLAWLISGLLLAATGLASTVPALLALSVASGAVSPFMAVSLSTRLASFTRPTRLRLISADQTVIRAAGTAGMLVIPALAAADPSAGFIAAGLATTVCAGLGWVASLVLPPGVINHADAFRGDASVAPSVRP